MAFLGLGRVGTKIREKYQRENWGYPVHRAAISFVCGAVASFHSLNYFYYWLHDKLREAGLQRVGSSRQAKAVDGVQIASSQQIERLTRELADAEARRLAENKSMRDAVESLKAQVNSLNSLIASGVHGVPHSPPSSVDEESSEDQEYVERTP